MKLKINKSQFQLLTSNFVLVEDNGIHNDDNNLISESLKRWRVRLFISGWECELEVGSSSSGTAIASVKRLFPQAIVTGSAKQV